MFKMRYLLVLCMILAVTINVSARPNKEKDEAYDEDALLNDEDGGVYAEEDDEENNDDYDEDKEESLPINNWPKIKTSPLTIAANVGDNVNLPCVTENADDFSILWKKDSVMLYQDTFKVGDQHTSHYKRFENQTLHIEKVQETDDGEYECSISTSPDLLVIKHRLNVLVPPRIKSATANKGMAKIMRGGILELSCQAEGKPAPKVSWSKDGSRIGEDNQKFNEASVTIENISREDAGLYVCMADNKVGTPVTEPVQVSVIHAPDMKIERMILGEKEMHLLCKVHASPKAEIFWMKNGKKLKHNTDSVKLETKHHENEHIVKFLNFQESDFGNYTCKAKNDIGENEKHVVVSGKPNTPKHESQSFVGDNYDVKSTWVISSMTPITGIQIQYRKKGRENVWISERPKVEGLTGHTNTIEHVLKNLESGVYEVRLRTENQYGWSDYSRGVSFEGKTDDISSYINKNEEPPMPVDERLAEPAVGAGSRTILSWTTILSIIIANMCSRFI